MILLEISLPPEAVALPLWVTAALLFLNAIKGYLPYVIDLTGIKKCQEDCKQLKGKIEKLQKDYDEVNRKYLILTGSLVVIRTKLKELGYDDIPDFERL